VFAELCAGHFCEDPVACEAELVREPRLPLVTKAVLAVHPKVRRRILAALYWIRSPRKMLMEERTDTLHFFAGYWNAFECLVDAVCILRPRPKER
jgi:hypothetical protein